MTLRSMIKKTMQNSVEERYLGDQIYQSEIFF